MARFPITETQIEVLARRMIAGFIEHTDVFPSPWVHPEKLEATLREFTAASERAVETRAAAKLASKKKKEVVAQLVDEMKYNLRYAEYMSHFENSTRMDDSKLSLIGWGAPRRSYSGESKGEGATAGGGRFKRPGQVKNLRIVGQGFGWIGN